MTLLTTSTIGPNWDEPYIGMEPIVGAQRDHTMLTTS